MSVESDVLHGTLDLIILKTFDAMGPLRGYAISLTKFFRLAKAVK